MYKYVLSSTKPLWTSQLLNFTDDVVVEDKGGG